MGQDLVGLGFTADIDKKYEKEALKAALGGIPDHDLIAALNEIDYSGGEFDTDDPAEIREILADAFDEYESALDGHRSTVTYGIPGSRAYFTFVGGSSWGDPPFEGFTQLEYAINTCRVFPEVAKAVGFVCGGLPSPDLAKEYPKKKQE